MKNLQKEKLDVVPFRSVDELREFEDYVPKYLMEIMAMADLLKGCPRGMMHEETLNTIASKIAESAYHALHFLERD